MKNELNMRPMTALGSRGIHKEKKVLLGDTDSSDDEEEEVYMQKREEEFLPVKGEPGMYYKVCITKVCSVALAQGCH
jgi:hypothetical protein